MKEEAYYNIVVRKCSQCGREFVPAPYHVFKEYGGKLFCSYSCHLKWEREYESGLKGHRVTMRARREKK